MTSEALRSDNTLPKKKKKKSSRTVSTEFGCVDTACNCGEQGTQAIPCLMLLFRTPGPLIIDVLRTEHGKEWYGIRWFQRPMVRFSSSFAYSASFLGWSGGFIGSVAATQCSHGLVGKVVSHINPSRRNRLCSTYCPMANGLECHVRMRRRRRRSPGREREAGASSLQPGPGLIGVD